MILIIETTRKKAKTFVKYNQNNQKLTRLCQVASFVKENFISDRIFKNSCFNRIFLFLNFLRK